MDPSGRQGSQQKKLRKSLHTSGRSTGAPAVASSSCLGAAAGAFASSSGTTAPSSGGLGTTAGAFAGSSGATAPSLGAGTGCHQSPSAFWTGMSPSSNPNSSEWLYPPGGFMNCLQMSYPCAPENSHFVGGPATGGTPSPNGSGSAKDGIDAQETIDVDGDETLEPTRTDKRLNWSHEEDVRLDVKLHSWSCAHGAGYGMLEFKFM
ncbi:unnamed protein product [Urochloa humidicola]